MQMRTFVDAKAMAESLRSALESRQVTLTHVEALEIIATQFGLEDWNMLAAKIKAAGENADIAFNLTAPILRIFDEAKAKEFYLGFLNFNLDWEYRFGNNFPLYAQVSRSGLTLHLSGHHGDASPGSSVVAEMKGIRQFQQELAAKNYTHMKPSIEDLPWGLVMEVIDPFSNRIRFTERAS